MNTKSTILILSLTLPLLFSGCKKARTCECDITVLNTTQKQLFTYPDVTKKDAEVFCESTEAQYNGLAQCDLK